MNLITTDEYAVYQTQILEAYGTQIVPPRTGKRGRPASAYKVAPPDLKYAVVHKTRENGRVVKIDYRVVFGTVVTVLAALAVSTVSKAINTAFVERHNGTDRQPQRSEGAEELLLLEGLGSASSGDVLHDVQLQLLLAGSDSSSAGESDEPVARTDTSDGRWIDRPCLVVSRVVGLPDCSTKVGHHAPPEP